MTSTAGIALGKEGGIPDCPPAFLLGPLAASAKREHVQGANLVAEGHSGTPVGRGGLPGLARERRRRRRWPGGSAAVPLGSNMPCALFCSPAGGLGGPVGLGTHPGIAGPSGVLRAVEDGWDGGRC